MWEIFQSIGAIDRLKGKGSLKNYQKKLEEHQQSEANLLIDMGIICFNDERYEESIEYLKQANEIYIKVNYEEGKAFVLDIIGDVYLSIRKMDLALNYYQKSFEIYASIRSDMKNDLFEKIKEVEDIKEAIQIVNEFKEVESLDEDLGDEEPPEETYVPHEKYVECHLNYEKVAIKLEKIYKLIKETYMVKGISKEEYETGYIKKSIYDARKYGDDKKEVALHLLSGYFLITEQKQYSALKSFKKAFNVARDIDDKKGEAFSLLLLGTVYYVLGSEDKIYEVFKKSLEMFKSSGYKDGESTAIDFINTLYSEDVCSDEVMFSKV
jgi:tetratricopeptide (TPR) repeat protein